MTLALPVACSKVQQYVSNHSDPATLDPHRHGGVFPCVGVVVMVIDSETTVADIDECIGHMWERRQMGADIVRQTLDPRIDALLDARLALADG